MCPNPAGPGLLKTYGEKHVGLLCTKISRIGWRGGTGGLD